MKSVFIRFGLALACLIGLGSPAFAACSGSPMSNGWCWPIAGGSWGSALGWHGSNSGFSGVHLAKDIMASEGTSVYAVSRGIVLITRSNVSFYGGATGCNPTATSIQGSGVVIRHYTADGKPFEVLYAHLKNVSVQRGDVVEPGTSVGQVRDYTWCGTTMNHLHLGVVFPARSLSAYDGSGTGNVWAGYGTTDKGFVDPVNFFATQSVGNIASCDPTKERCLIRPNGPVGWFPPVLDCEQAAQWFNLATVNGEKTAVGTTVKSSCPQSCYAN